MQKQKLSKKDCQIDTEWMVFDIGPKHSNSRKGKPTQKDSQIQINRIDSLPCIPL